MESKPKNWIDANSKHISIQLIQKCNSKNDLRLCYCLMSVVTTGSCIATFKNNSIQLVGEWIAIDKCKLIDLIQKNLSHKWHFYIVTTITIFLHSLTTFKEVCITKTMSSYGPFKTIFLQFIKLWAHPTNKELQNHFKLVAASFNWFWSSHWQNWSIKLGMYKKEYP